MSSQLFQSGVSPQSAKSPRVNFNMAPLPLAAWLSYVESLMNNELSFVPCG